VQPPNPVSADAFRLARAGETIMLDFGRVDGVPLPSGVVSILVTDRVEMPLETARRLMVWLDDALRPHASRLQAEEARQLAPAAIRPGQVPPRELPARPAPDESGEKAAQLLRLVGAWGAPHQYERSVRFSEAAMQGNRFLLTLNRRDVPGDALEQCLAVCDQFGMPPALREAAVAQFDMAQCVHFGFEGDPASIVCKFYLEPAISLADQQHARANNVPVLQHLAFKWDLLREAAVTTRYWWYPGLSADEMAQRLALLYRGEHAESQAIALALLQLATARTGADALQWVEVEEDENDRRSYDLNIYNAKVKLRDVQDLVQRMRDSFAIRPGQFQALFDQIKGMELGHLAGGIHRNGKDFFNLYYGAIGLPHYNEQIS
jgi:tryptophan halogenase